MSDPKPNKQAPELLSRSKQINLRLDDDLYERAMKSARHYGGLSAVIRAMLRKFVEGEQNFDIRDLLKEATAAQPRTPSKPRPPRKKKK